MSLPFFLAILFAVIGWWKLPSTLREARSDLAPYRAVAAVIYLLISFAWGCAAAGIQVVVAVTP